MSFFSTYFPNTHKLYNVRPESCPCPISPMLPLLPFFCCCDAWDSILTWCNEPAPKPTTKETPENKTFTPRFTACAVQQSDMAIPENSTIFSQPPRQKME